MDSDAVLTMLQEVAADLITPRFRALADGEVMEKNPGDLVTIADQQAEVEITRRLRAAYPDALIVGEEATATNPGLLHNLDRVEHWFTVDPVDGTKNFVEGSANHAVMVAEVRGGETVRGWIWQPEHRTAYVTERGSGSWQDGKRMQAPQPAEPPVGVTSKRRYVGERLGDLEPLRLSWACCGVDYPNLAKAEADFIVYSATMPWDHAPGSLLLQEIGGEVSHRDGTPYRPAQTSGGLVAANTAQVHERIMSLIPR